MDNLKKQQSETLSGMLETNSLSYFDKEYSNMQEKINDIRFMTIAHQQIGLIEDENAVDIFFKYEKKVNKLNETVIAFR